MKESYIVDAVRTPIGNLGGTLSKVRTDDLAALVISSLLNRHPDLDKEAVDDVILGCANQAYSRRNQQGRITGMWQEWPCC